MLRDFDDFGRDVGRRRHHVDHLRRDCGARHPVVFRRGRILREREALHRLDFADAECAIRRRARQHDADGVRTERARERSKEKIDGVVLAPIGGPPAQMEMAVDELHLRVRRHDVHAIGGDAHALGGLQDGKRRVAGKKRRQRTSVVGREMLDEDDREVGIAWQPFEKLRERLESSSRRAHADDAEVGCRPWGSGQRPHCGSWCSSSGARPLSHASRHVPAPDFSGHDGLLDIAQTSCPRGD